MLCAISGEAPQEPVASKKSGNVFEKRLIEAYVAEHHKDPVSGEELEFDDLLSLQSPRQTQPRPPTFTSVPSLLSSLQNEWDALMLEVYESKQTTHELRQQLSSVQYENDAATRVIARLLKERNEAREALSQMGVGQLKMDSAPAATTNGNANVETHVNGATSLLSEEHVQAIKALQSKLSQSRRKRQVPENWTTVDKIQDFKLGSQRPRLINEGARAFATDTNIDKGGKNVFVGGSEGIALYNLPRDEVVRCMSFGNVEITAGVCIDFETKLQCAAALATGEVKIFDGDEEIISFNDHAGSANALALHPGRRILASVGDDKTVVLYDVLKSVKLAQFATEDSLTACEFHPDGVYLAVGSRSGTVSIYTFTTATKEHTFQFSGPIKGLAASENGTWIAAAIEGQSVVEIITLTKMTIAHKLDFGSPVDVIEWDYTGQYLAAGGPNFVGVYAYDKAAKSWSNPLTQAVDVAGLHWGPLAKGLIILHTAGNVGLVR